MEDVVFDQVMLIMNKYESELLKGQKKRKGQKVECKASGFKEIRSLPTDDQLEILGTLKE